MFFKLRPKMENLEPDKVLAMFMVLGIAKVGLFVTIRGVFCLISY